MVEILVDLLGGRNIPVRRREARIGVDEPQRVLVGIVGGLEPLARLGDVAAEIGDESGMIVAENIETAAREPVDELQRPLRVARTRVGPGREQGGREIGAAAAAGARQLRPRRGELLQAEIAHRLDEMGEAVVGIDAQDPVGHHESVVEIAVGDGGDEGLLQQIRIMRIIAQSVARKGRGGAGIVLVGRDQRRKIIAGETFPDVEPGIDRIAADRKGRRAEKTERRKECGGCEQAAAARGQRGQEIAQRPRRTPARHRQSRHDRETYHQGMGITKIRSCSIDQRRINHDQAHYTVETERLCGRIDQAGKCSESKAMPEGHARENSGVIEVRSWVEFREQRYRV